MNQLVQDKEVPLWTWHVRWFVPEQQEEYHVDLLPTGEIVGFAHIVAEDTPGESVAPEQAQHIAERYLTEDRGLTLDDWELYNASTETLPHRSDHTLTWVKRGVQIGEGDVRVSVTVQGDEVGRFGNWFRVPEAFSREYWEQQSRAWLLDDVATTVATVFTLGGVLVVFWGLFTGLKIGWLPVVTGLTVGVVDLLDWLNYLPLIDAGYNTAVDYRIYILNQLGNYVFSALFKALLVAFLMLSGKWLVRAVWPRQHKLVPHIRARWTRLARSSWRGMMLGGLMGAYFILFYTIADALGAWSPVQTPSLNLLATPFPFVAAIWLGLLPALREELKYRALGMGLTMRLTRGRVWLALLIPSLLWGFAHADYVTDPVGLRGVELTLSSLLLSGLFFLLFDLTTTVVAHYTYNASLISVILIRSGNPAFVITGVVAVLLGLVPGGVALIRRLRGRHQEEPIAPTVSVGREEDWATARALDDEWVEEERSPRQLVCLCTADGQLQGYALGAIENTASEGRVGVVSRIFVAKPYRSRYHGTALYWSLAEWFHERGVTEIRVQVPLGDVGASTFWATQGFRPKTRLWRKKSVESILEGM